MVIATDDERVRAEAAGLPVDGEVWAVASADGTTVLAWLALTSGSGERRVRAVAAGDPADPLVREAVAASRETLIAALHDEMSRTE